MWDERKKKFQKFKSHYNFILFVKEMKISYHLPTKSTSILLWTCIVQVYFDISMILKVSSLLEIFFEIFREYALTSKFSQKGFEPLQSFWDIVSRHAGIFENAEDRPCLR